MLLPWGRPALMATPKFQAYTLRLPSMLGGIINKNRPYRPIKVVLRIDNRGSQKIKDPMLMYINGSQKIKIIKQSTRKKWTFFTNSFMKITTSLTFFEISRIGGSLILIFFQRNETSSSLILKY
jgi:hypothetical protein